MSRQLDAAWKAAVVSALIALSPASTAFGQRWIRRSEGEYYGMGADGTIGRGTLILPGGPSDWNVGGPVRTIPRATAPVSTYFSGYASTPARPYRTTRTYEPGDGYRYPLYYNPAGGTYFYYPVGRR